MSVKLKYYRSRSTSDILDDDRSQKSSLSLENKYKTYSSVDFKKNSCEQKKVQATRKTQNFMKKLFASMERKNEACKADDEFYATYYRGNDNSNPYSDYSFNGKSENFEEIEKTETKSLISNLTTDELSLQNFKHEQNSKPEFINTEMSIYVNVNENVSRQKYSNSRDIKNTKFCKYEEENGSKTNEQQKFIDTGSIKVKHEDLVVGVIGNNEQKRFLDFCSSFNSSIFRVDSENPSNTQDSCILKQNKNNKRSILQKLLFTNSNKVEKRTREKSHGDIHTKTLNRSRTFKDFVISIVKRKKSGNGKKSGCFTSNSQVLANSVMFDSKGNIILPRVSSFQNLASPYDK